MHPAQKTTLDKPHYIDRILEAMILSDVGCWLWPTTAGNGYGVITNRKCGTFYAHRVVAEWFGRTPPDSERWQIDHLCMVRNCVNPSHLEFVTPAVNRQRAIVQRKTTCKRGHPWIAENIYLRPDTGRRQCLICRRADWHKWKARQDQR